MKPGELEVLHEEMETIHTLTLVGELDLASAEALESKVSTLCLDGGASEITLECGRLTFIDSTGLRAILAGQGLCASNGCAFVLENCTPTTMRLLRLAGVDEILGVDDQPSGATETEPTGS